MAVPDDPQQSRAYLQAELEAQRQQIAQLQTAMMEMMQRDATQSVPTAPYPPHPGGALAYRPDGTAVHARHPPPPPMPTSMAAPQLAVGSGTDPSTWSVPRGTQAGQVFLVDGDYYVAIPRPQHRGPLPPIAPRR